MAQARRYTSESNTCEPTWQWKPASETCGSESATVPVYVLFVDPASGTLHIHAGETLREVALFDVDGRWLTTVAASADQCTIDVSYLPAGVYACRITTATGRTELGKFAVR